MPAKVMIVSGDQQGQEFWIEEEVVRLGNDDSCAIRLKGTDVPAHLGTLEYRKGNYVLYNRSGQPLVLNNQPLKEMANSPWPAGRDLRVTSRLTLRLVVEGDPAPVKQIKPAILEEEEKEDTAKNLEVEEEPAKATSSKTLQQLLLIVIVIGTLAFLLFVDTEGGAPEKTRNEAEEFHYLVKTLAEKETPKGAAGSLNLQELRKQLQEARLAELRNDRKQAIFLYSHLRDTLLRKETSGATLTEPEKQLRSFVIAQLKKLGTETVITE